MTDLRKSVVLRFLRVALAGAIGATLPLIPGLTVLFPEPYRPFLSALLAAVVVAADKYRRSL